jgi:tRNA/rRNA methyltransferase
METHLPPHTSALDRFRVVLCNPDSSYNIGAVCRAMKTMGLTRLDIAGRILNFDPEKIRFMAVHAYEVFDEAGRFATLGEALEGSVISAGVTRRGGKNRKHSHFLPEEFAMRTLSGPSRTSLQVPGSVALVFGNEEHGLTTEELAECSCAINIPSSPAFPSLNLSHAVQVVTYSIFRTAALLHYDSIDIDVESAVFGAERPVDRRRLDQLVGAAVDSLTALGFFRISDSEPTRVFLRDIMSRATMSPRELDIMTNIFRKIRHIKK